MVLWYLARGLAERAAGDRAVEPGRARLDGARPGRRRLVDGPAGAAGAASDRGGVLEDRRPDRRSPASAAWSITPGDRLGDGAGLRRSAPCWHRCWRSASCICTRPRPQPAALDHRLADRADPGHCADGRRRARQSRPQRTAPQGHHLHVPVLLPGHHRHGQGAALARSAAARPDAHLQRHAARRCSGSCAGRRATRFLFASLKVAIAVSLVGAIVGELPTGAQAGLGARLLSGSYYGQTIQIWSALIMAALRRRGAGARRRLASSGWSCAHGERRREAAPAAHRRLRCSLLAAGAAGRPRSRAARRLRRHSSVIALASRFGRAAAHCWRCGFAARRAARSTALARRAFLTSVRRRRCRLRRRPPGRVRHRRRPGSGCSSPAGRCSSGSG